MGQKCCVEETVTTKHGLVYALITFVEKETNKAVRGWITEIGYKDEAPKLDEEDKEDEVSSTSEYEEESEYESDNVEEQSPQVVEETPLNVGDNCAFYVNRHYEALEVRKSFLHSSGSVVGELKPGQICYVTEVEGRCARIERCDDDGRHGTDLCGWITYKEKDEPMFLGRAEWHEAMLETEDGQGCTVWKMG